MNADQMKTRTKKFALEIIKMAEDLPESPATRLIRKQIIGCGTSVGSNYRASCRAKSPADFVAKLGIVEEEADESMFWMELLSEAGIVESHRIKSLYKEADEILAITVASIKTAREKIRPAEKKYPQSAIRNPQSV